MNILYSSYQLVKIRVGKYSSQLIEPTHKIQSGEKGWVKINLLPPNKLNISH